MTEPKWIKEPRKKAHETEPITVNIRKEFIEELEQLRENEDKDDFYDKVFFIGLCELKEAKQWREEHEAAEIKGGEKE